MRCLLKASEIRGSRSAERGIQMKKQQSAILLVLLAMGATLYLMSRPQCGLGCKTILQHLLSHELDAFV